MNALTVAVAILGFAVSQASAAIAVPRKADVERTLRQHFADETITVISAAAVTPTDCVPVAEKLVQVDSSGNAFVRMRCANAATALPFLVLAHGGFLRRLPGKGSEDTRKLVRQGTRLKAQLVRGKTRIVFSVLALKTCKVGDLLRVVTSNRRQIFTGRLKEDLTVELQ